MVVNLISFNETPPSFFAQESFSATGTSAASLSMILWPSFFNQEKPSPVEPVSGRDVPPVATTQDPALTSDPSFRRTTTLLPEETAKPATAAPVFTSTPPSFIYLTSTSQTDRALSDTGKIRPSFSSLVAIPLLLKNSSASLTPNWEKAEKRN